MGSGKGHRGDPAQLCGYAVCDRSFMILEHREVDHAEQQVALEPVPEIPRQGAGSVIRQRGRTVGRRHDPQRASDASGGIELDQLPSPGLACQGYGASTTVKEQRERRQALSLGRGTLDRKVVRDGSRDLVAQSPPDRILFAPSSVGREGSLDLPSASSAGVQRASNASVHPGPERGELGIEAPGRRRPFGATVVVKRREVDSRAAQHDRGLHPDPDMRGQGELPARRGPGRMREAAIRLEKETRPTVGMRPEELVSTPGDELRFRNDPHQACLLGGSHERFGVTTETALGAAGVREPGERGDVDGNGRRAGRHGSGRLETRVPGINPARSVLGDGRPKA